MLAYYVKLDVGTYVRSAFALCECVSGMWYVDEFEQISWNFWPETKIISLYQNWNYVVIQYVGFWNQPYTISQVNQLQSFYQSKEIKFTANSI